WLRWHEPTWMYSFLRNQRGSWETWALAWFGVRRYRFSERKSRLFACACCSRVAHLLPTDEARPCLAVTERYAEGLATAAELEKAINASMESCAVESRRRAQAGVPWNRHEIEAVNAISRVHRTEAHGRQGVFRAAVEAWAGAAAARALVGTLQA